MLPLHITRGLPKISALFYLTHENIQRVFYVACRQYASLVSAYIAHIPTTHTAHLSQLKADVSRKILYK